MVYGRQYVAGGILLAAYGRWNVASGMWQVAGGR